MLPDALSGKPSLLDHGLDPVECRFELVRSDVPLNRDDEGEALLQRLLNHPDDSEPQTGRPLVWNLDLECHLPTSCGEQRTRRPEHHAARCPLAPRIRRGLL